MMFSLGLPERTRTRVEVAGRVQLNETEQDALVVSKVVHICAVVLYILCTVYLCKIGITFAVLIIAPPATFGLAGIIEAFMAESTPAQTVRAVLESIGKTIIGIIIMMIMLKLASTS